MTDYISLGRQFVKWESDREIDIDIERWFVGLDTSFDWEGLAARRRVVILAEAGSGKSTEMREEAKRLAAGGRTVFITTLQRIGQKGGLEGALGRAEWRRYEDWQASGESCWLFLDSVDEAKRADFSLFDVLTDVADAIEGVAGRVHILLSGRVSDWEFKRDLATLLERVPIPPPDEKIEPITPDQKLIAALKREAPKAVEPVEKPLVVAMAALDRSRVELFARHQGIGDVERMFAALDRQHLWSFARRPTDLDWLVGYWRANGRFGSLQEMLDVSVTERLKETNIGQARKDVLDGDKARAAVERIGAALVLQRLDTLVVPDTDGEARKQVSFLDVKDVVPDLIPAEQHALINRPIFDPATPGFVRLHNDNQGEVRGFLAAKWLHRLRRTGNLTVSRIFELLFADTYGVRLVRPSMRATAAWLSLWVPEVAQEVIVRDPRLLMDAGDPASLSLDVRVRVLDAMIPLCEEDEHIAIPNQDALRRFAQPDLAGFIRERWSTHKEATGPRVLLLLLIHLGEIRACADIASEVALCGYRDRYTPIFGGRALLSTGDAGQLRTYLDHLVGSAKEVHPTVVWDALDELYPKIATTSELLTLMATVKPKGNDGALDLDYHGPRLAARLPDRAAANEMVETLIGRLEVKFDLFRATSNPQDERLLETLEIAAARYADLLPQDELDTIIVDAGVRVGESRRMGRGRRRAKERDALDLVTQINASSQRRRTALWRCAELFREARETMLTSPWQLQFIGFAPTLQATDLEWLLADMASRTDPNDLRLATNGALTVWREMGSDPAMLARIKAVSAAAVAAETIASATAEPKADSAFAKEEARHRRRVARDAVEEAKKDQSWIDFRNELQADPSALLRFRLPENGTVDGRLYHIWHLLSGLGDNRSHYAISDLAALRPLFGEAVTDAFRDAMILYWRQLATTLPSEVPIEERRTSRANDLMGIVGVSLEAANKPGWAAALNDDQARLAARFATRELNGFPKWLDELAGTHPEIVGQTLWAYVQSDLDPSNDEYRTRLQDVAGASDTIATLMAPRMSTWLAEHEDAPIAVLDHMLNLIARSPDALAAAMPTIAQRCIEPLGRAVRAAYIGAAYSYDAEQATDLLVRALDTLSPRDQVILAQAALPRAFGTRYSPGNLKSSAVPFVSLERLVLLAFDKVRPDDDNRHPDLEAYSPDERDHAEDARSALFNTLVNTPGYATFYALQRFREIPDFPVWDRRLRELAYDRAASDSEPEPMRAQDVLTFERFHELVPATSADLQRVGIARLGDIEHQLQHGDYNQGVTVARLPHEVDVQNWFAAALHSLKGHSYSLEREPHVGDEKEPDIRLTSLRDPQARAPIEIKVAASWSLRELEEALTVQLQGRYLRDRDNRFGILLVVHNSVRSRGWQRGNDWLTFEEIMAHLAGIAERMAAADALAPQMAVIGIDVSAFAERLEAEKKQAARLVADDAGG